MSRRTFIITIDPSSPMIDIDGLRSFITTSQEIVSWWNHIPLVFLVTSDLDADGLSEKVRPFTGKARFLVMEVNPAESEGSLPKPSWQWIHNHSRSDDQVGDRA